MEILACGPYIGDFENEILTFRPYCKWLQESVEHDCMYICTHVNRGFLYHFIPEENIIPVYEDLSRDELGQKGYIHDFIKQKDYNILLKKFKNEIIEKEKCNKKDIIQYNLNYIKSKPSVPLYNKCFERIYIEENNVEKSVILIPYKDESDKKLLEIYKYLKNKYNCIIIGDQKVDFPEENKLLHYIDYFENGCKYIIKYINNSKAVICPVSFWTALCNLQGVNVFSWGEQVSQFKEEGGIYYFCNKKSFIIPTNKNIEVKKLLYYMDKFLEEL